MANLSSEKYIIGSQDRKTGKVSFSTSPVQHDSLYIAKTEAERLAKNYPEKEFVVCKIAGIVGVVNINWR